MKNEKRMAAIDLLTLPKKTILWIGGIASICLLANLSLGPEFLLVKMSILTVLALLVGICIGAVAPIYISRK